MPVFEGSRYEGVQYTAITGKDLVTRKYLHLRIPKTFEEVEQDWILHEVQEGETLDFLMYKYGGESAKNTIKWWLLADVNNVMWPLDLPAGTQLAIPTRLVGGTEV